MRQQWFESTRLCSSTSTSADVFNRMLHNITRGWNCCINYIFFSISWRRKIDSLKKMLSAYRHKAMLFIYTILYHMVSQIEEASNVWRYLDGLANVAQMEIQKWKKRIDKNGVHWKFLNYKTKWLYNSKKERVRKGSEEKWFVDVFALLTHINRKACLWLFKTGGR